LTKYSADKQLTSCPCTLICPLKGIAAISPLFFLGEICLQFQQQIDFYNNIRYHEGNFVLAMCVLIRHFVGLLHELWKKYPCKWLYGKQFLWLSIGHWLANINNYWYQVTNHFDWDRLMDWISDDWFSSIILHTGIKEPVHGLTVPLPRLRHFDRKVLRWDWNFWKTCEVLKFFPSLWKTSWKFFVNKFYPVNIFWILHKLTYENTDSYKGEWICCTLTGVIWNVWVILNPCTSDVGKHHL